MTQKQIFIKTITDDTINFLNELLKNNVREIKSTEVNTFINNSIKDFYGNEQIKPEEIKKAQELDDVRFNDLIKTNIYDFLVSNGFIYNHQLRIFEK